MAHYPIAGIILSLKSMLRGTLPAKTPVLPQELEHLDLLIGKLENIGCKPILVITGYDPFFICQKLEHDTFKCFQNTNPPSGELSVLRMAIEQLPEEVFGFLLCFLENPQVKQETFKAIFQMAQAFPDHIVIPQFHGQYGRPIYVSKKFFDVLLNMPANANTLDVLDNLLDDIKFLPVNDAAILDEFSPENEDSLLH